MYMHYANIIIIIIIIIDIYYAVTVKLIYSSEF